MNIFDTQKRLDTLLWISLKKTVELFLEKFLQKYLRIISEENPWKNSLSSEKMQEKFLKLSMEEYLKEILKSFLFELLLESLQELPPKSNNARSTAGIPAQFSEWITVVNLEHISAKKF